jgi:hypothetical protein
LPLIIIVVRPSALNSLFQWALNHYANAVF